MQSRVTKIKIGTLGIIAVLASITTILALGTTVASGSVFAYDACEKGGPSTHNPHCPSSSSPALRVKPVEGWK